MLDKHLKDKPCVVVIDPTTGLKALSEEFDRLGVGLIVIETENNELFPNFFKSIDEKLVSLKLRSLKSDVPKTIKELSQKYLISNICAGDELTIALAEKCSYENLNQRGNDPATSQLRLSKYDMSEELAAKDIYIPQQLSFDPAVEKLDSLYQSLIDFHFPIVIKPNISTGSTCTYKCQTIENLEEVFNVLKRDFENSPVPVSTNFIAQEFVQGKEYLVNSFSYSGKHHISGVYNYDKFYNHNIPIYQSVNFDGFGSVEEEICEFVENALDVLGNKEGLVNTDLIRGQNETALLEINCRMVGFNNWLSRLEVHLFGASQATLLGKQALGQLENYRSDLKDSKKFGKLIMLQSKEDKADFSPKDDLFLQFPSYLEHGWNKAPGEFLNSARSLVEDTVGYVLLSHQSREQLETDYKTIVNLQNKGELF